MDPRRFDSLARSLATPKTRRGFLGTLAALGAGLGVRGAANAQVTQAQCGNKLCAANPGVCANGCVCCVWGNGNSRCRPPGACTGTIVGPGTTTTTTVPPTTTTIAPTTTTVAPTTTPTPLTTTSAPTTTTTTTSVPLPGTCSLCEPGFVRCPGNPSGCIPDTSCSGEPVCCSNNGLGVSIICGFQGQCQPGSAPPVSACPPAS